MVLPCLTVLLTWINDESLTDICFMLWLMESISRAMIVGSALRWSYLPVPKLLKAGEPCYVRRSNVPW